MTISDWLNDKNRDYNTGVEFYAASPVVKTRILTGLRKGKNPRNMAVLIKELRPFKNKSAKPAPPPIAIAKKEPIKPPRIKSVQQEAEKEILIQKSQESFFKKIRYGDLPVELRPRFKQLKDIFYEMSTLKFLLNDLPAKKEKDALQVILQIEALDEVKDLIWKEIDHWMKYKTILETKTGEDFSNLTPQQLYLKKVNLVNYIHKKTGRIEKWKIEMEKETRKPERLKIQQQINRTLKDMHQHELDIKTIEGIL